MSDAGKEGVIINNYVMTQQKLKAAQKVLVDNGIDAGESAVVLQALCYVLLDVETGDLLDW